VDLLTCWRGQFGRYLSIAVWKLFPYCLMWCLWREHNDQNFEDRERTVVELNVFFFKTLYHRMIAYNCFHISSVHDFLDILTFSL
jgi:hypothetical protein